MPYDLANRLVVGIASSALFDLTESHEIFAKYGETEYRRYQEVNLNSPLSPGIAFQFIRRLLSLNNLTSEADPLVEVIMLSQNDPDTGLRVMRSIQEYNLQVSRAIFMQGRSPYHFMPALNMSLFLSANDDDVRNAVAEGLPAGRVFGIKGFDDTSDETLRIAFDFDGILADDAAEIIYQEEGIEILRAHEIQELATPHDPGPLRDFLVNIHRIQLRERIHMEATPGYSPRVQISLVTARDAPAHERALASLKSWGVTVNNAFFLGGVDKGKVLEILHPHIFFDDQEVHINSAARTTPSAHVPFGRLNKLHRAATNDQECAETVPAIRPDGNT